MKKITLFLTLLLMLAVSATQAKSTQVDSTQLNAVQVYSDIKAGLEGLAVGLKTTADHVYPVLVKQQLIQSYTYLCVPIAFVLLLIVVIYNILKGCSLNDFVFSLLITLLILLFSGSLILMPDIITGFVNPEYGAIQDIVNFVK